MKKIIPYFLFITSIFFATYFWDKINIPFNINDAHLGDSYFKNQHHSQNDTLRFIFYLSFPFLILILYYQYFEKIFFKNFKEIIFKYDTDVIKNSKKLKLLCLITIIIVVLEFFFIDFKDLDKHIDIFHEGLWLTASNNALIKNEFWQSSYIGRGFFGNFYPLLLWKFSNIESIGITRFFNIFVILINKMMLLLIAYRIVSSCNLEKKGKIIFYLIFALTLLIFTSYVSPVFFLRSFLLLLFIFLLLNFIILEKKKLVNTIFLGFLSSFGMFWYIDIGIYINLILFLLLTMLLVTKEIKFLFTLIFSIILGWSFFYLYIPKEEFIQFLENTKLIISTIDYIHGLIFPTPFLSQDSRSTKSLLLFLITGFLIIKAINSMHKQESKFLLINLYLFILSILYFKYGLSRSDGGHIRIASGFVYIPLFSMCYYKTIDFYLSKKNFLFKNSNNIGFALLIIFFTSIFFDKKFEDKSFLNLFSSKSNINKLLNYSDKRFLNKNYQELIKKYKKLSYKDECVMVFTNEVALPYFFKKPTCSKYFLMYVATPIKIQENIIKDLKITIPEYLIYKSDIDIYGHSGNRLKLLDSYINEQYSFYKKLDYWQVYKKK